MFGNLLENALQKAYPKPVSGQLATQFPDESQVNKVGILNFAGRMVKEFLVQDGSNKAEGAMENENPEVYLVSPDTKFGFRRTIWVVKQ